MGYHVGELAAQERAGLLEQAAHVAAVVQGSIHPAVAAFLAAQPMLVVSGVDAEGDVWATALAGEPGFLDVTGPAALTVAAAPLPGDPLYDVLAAPARVGVIAIEPGTRRRVRLNGTTYPTAEGLRIDLAEVYANCPKYIQKRVPRLVASTPAEPRVSTGLSEQDRAFVDAADTFFVATADHDGNGDASHRGGNPGFLRALAPHRLQWPDYVGNSMFNTLGNLQVNPRAGLLLPDWSDGTLLHLTGDATVDWDPDHAARVPGARRIVDFTVRRVVRVPRAWPLRWSAPEYSRFNPDVLRPEGAPA